MDELGDGIGLHLFHDAAAMYFHGFFDDTQVIGNLLVEG